MCWFQYKWSLRLPVNLQVDEDNDCLLVSWVPQDVLSMSHSLCGYICHFCNIHPLLNVRHNNTQLELVTMT